MDILLVKLVNIVDILTEMIVDRLGSVPHLQKFKKKFVGFNVFLHNISGFRMFSYHLSTL